MNLIKTLSWPTILNSQGLHTRCQKTKMANEIIMHQKEFYSYMTKRKMAPLHPNKGLVNSDMLSAKCFKLKCERVLHSENSAINRSRYQDAVNHYKSLLEQSTCRHCFYIAENNGSPNPLRNTFTQITQILNYHPA